MVGFVQSDAFFTLKLDVAFKQMLVCIDLEIHCPFENCTLQDFPTLNCV